MENNSIPASKSNNSSEIPNGNSYINVLNSKIGRWKTKIVQSTQNRQQKNKNLSELDILGDFILDYNQNIEIVDGFRESPDFIITHEGDEIGVEVRELVVNQVSKEDEGVLKGISNEVIRELKNDTTISSGEYEIEFYSYTKIKDNRNQIKNDLIEKIKSPNFQSEFISKIIHILGPELRLNIVSAYFTAPSKKSNFIKEAIIEKDKKVDNYRNKSEIQKIWLLLKINCTNQSGSYCSIEELLPEGKVNSSFDRVFIYDHFKGVVFPLEIIPYN